MLVTSATMAASCCARRLASWIICDASCGWLPSAAAIVGMSSVRLPPAVVLASTSCEPSPYDGLNVVVDDSEYHMGWTASKSAVCATKAR